MTISQSSSSCSSRADLAVRQAIHPAFWKWLEHLARWQQKRRAAAELARLAATGDHLLRDIGLEPQMIRSSPAAALEYLVRRC